MDSLNPLMMVQAFAQAGKDVSRLSWILLVWLLALVAMGAFVLNNRWRSKTASAGVHKAKPKGGVRHMQPSSTEPFVPVVYLRSV